jgi:hypothetical protein
VASRDLTPLILVASGVGFFAASIYIAVKALNLPAALLAAGIGYLLVSLGVETYKESCRKDVR